MTRVLLTGATGFIGRALAPALAQADFEVRAAGRAPLKHYAHYPIKGLDAQTDWRAALEGADAVMHLAGPAHARFPEAVVQREIAEATAALAEQAQAAGVTRFIFMSSIMATAARTQGAPVCESDPPAPRNAYGRAKLDAEAAVLACGAMKTIIIRPPLVHAASANGNFGRLLRLAWSGAPLPFADLRNKRSVISRVALIEAIKTVLASPDGPDGVFHVASTPALSTGQIVAALRHGMRRRSGLFRAPPLTWFAPRQLRESLEVCDHAFRGAYGYGYCANVSAQDGLEACGAAWRTRV